jgi:hypothetical protein
MPPLMSPASQDPLPVHGFRRITGLLSDVVLSLLAVLLVPLFVLALGIPIALLVRLLLALIG